MKQFVSSFVIEDPISIQDRLRLESLINDLLPEILLRNRAFPISSVSVRLEYSVAHKEPLVRMKVRGSYVPFIPNSSIDSVEEDTGNNRVTFSRNGTKYVVESTLD